jgi:hypothetical protein
MTRLLFGKKQIALVAAGSHDKTQRNTGKQGSQHEM